MGHRQKMSKILHDVLGSNNVYFQPPPSLKMSFPCIVYEMSGIGTTFADNEPYHLDHIYRVIYIDYDPDSGIPDKIAMLPHCISERPYKSDNKYYHAFRITI